MDEPDAVLVTVIEEVAPGEFIASSHRVSRSLSRPEVLRRVDLVLQEFLWKQSHQTSSRTFLVFFFVVFAFFFVVFAFFTIGHTSRTSASSSAASSRRVK